MIRQISLKQILVDGTILSVLLTVIVFGSLYVNPLMKIDNYKSGSMSFLVNDKTLCTVHTGIAQKFAHAIKHWYEDKHQGDN